jgi:lycopene cyclase domain-containing protein
MTYFGFLAYYLCIPIVILAAVAWWDGRHGRIMPAALSSWSPYAAIAAHAIVALLYTTPWDNYLVATRVWWYRPELVTGIVFGWVPIEEYIFFILQPILTGLWFIFLARRLPVPTAPLDGRSHRWFRWGGLALCAAIWIPAIAVLWMGSQPLTYMALLMAWALPPVMLQLGFGGDILWHFRRLVLLTLVPASIYLSVADATAIESGTWTINPLQSVNILVGGLPIEEIVFFFMTNILISFGMTLVLAQASQERAPKVLLRLFHRLAGDTALRA